MKVTMSPIVAGLSGRAADVVAATWKGRAYIRKHVIPSNPRSAAQTAVRESMARIPPLWRSLSAFIHTAQNEYATGSRMSGYNWFARRNRLLEEDFRAQNLTPPNEDLPRPLSLDLTDMTGGDCQVDWTGGETGADFDIEIWTRKQSGESEDNKFVQNSTGSVLSSAGTETISLEASEDFMVIVFIRNSSTDEVSESIADDISLGA